MYPNEMELQWSILIVLYPFITGLVAGAFILASLERVFSVEAVKPTYRLALLTALAFLLVAPLPLQLHLGHPERSFEMYLTPHTSLGDGDVRLRLPLVPDGGAAARDLARLPARHRAARAQPRAGRCASSTALLTLGSDDVSEEALRVDDRAALRGHADRHPLGLPAARLRRLHLRLGQGEPLVVDAADADRVPVLGDRLRHRRGDAALHGDHAGCAGSRSTCAASTRSRATCSTPSSSTSRSRCST